MAYEMSSKLFVQPQNFRTLKMAVVFALFYMSMTFSFTICLISMFGLQCLHCHWKYKVLA